jgi:hypothetical protein
MVLNSSCVTSLVELVNGTYVSADVSAHMLVASSLSTNGAGDVGLCNRLPAAVAHFCTLQIQQSADESAVLETRALCAPADCASHELHPAHFNIALHSMPGRADVTIACIDDAQPLNAAGVSAVCVIVALVLLVSCASVVRLAEASRQAPQTSTAPEEPLVTPLAREVESGTDAAPASSTAQRTSLFSRGAARGMLMAFDAGGNLRQLTASGRKFTALEGLRVCCMLWIILAHTYTASHLNPSAHAARWN